MVEVIKEEQIELGVWHKYVEGREWGLPEGEEKERAQNEFNAIVRRCPQCYFSCSYIDDEEFEEASRWEREKWVCDDCNVIYTVNASNYRGSMGLEIWEVLTS